MLFLKRWHNFNVLLRSSLNIEWNDSEKHFLKFVLYHWTRIFPNNAIKEIISVIIEIYESAVSNTTKKRWKIDGDYRRFKSEYLNCIYMYIYIHSIAKCDQICKQTNRLILRGKFGFLNRNKTVLGFFFVTMKSWKSRVVLLQEQHWVKHLKLWPALCSGSGWADDIMLIKSVLPCSFWAFLGPITSCESGSIS